MSRKDVCAGHSPWSGTAKQVSAAFELAKLGLLPTGQQSDNIDLVLLLSSVRAESEVGLAQPDHNTGDTNHENHPK